MNESLSLQDIQQNLQALHFEKVLSLLKQNPNLKEENAFWYDLMQAKALRGLYQYDKALAVISSLEEEASQAQLPWLLAEKGKLLFVCGKIDQARVLLEDALEDASMQFFCQTNMALASLMAQEGQIERAFEELEPVHAWFENPEHRNDPSYTEMCTLYGDLYTFVNDFEKAQDWYQAGLLSIPYAIPSSWQNLRQALLLNNLSDLYEQEEDFTKALFAMHQAFASMELVSDAEISDLSSYWLDLIFSLANIYANMDDYESALQILVHASWLLQNQPPLQILYYTARYHYFKGLFLFYMLSSEQKDLEQAAYHLQSAYDIQKDLVARGQDKKEHLAKTCYYLAYCLPESSPQKIRLYQEAYPIFKALVEKEPLFYLDGIAQITNEMGCYHALQNVHPRIAYNDYLEAEASYEELLRRFEKDPFALQSLLVTRLNLLWQAIKMALPDGTATQICDRIMDTLDQLVDQECDMTEIQQIMDSFLDRHRVIPLEKRYQQWLSDHHALH